MLEVGWEGLQRRVGRECYRRVERGLGEGWAVEGLFQEFSDESRRVGEILCIIWCGEKVC